MSQFVNGTFKQNLLDFIRDEQLDQSLNTVDVIQDCLAVISHLAVKLPQDMYEKAKREVRDEFISKLS
jgi:hypothetical protein